VKTCILLVSAIACCVIPSYSMGQSFKGLFRSQGSGAEPENVQICQKNGAGCTLTVWVKATGKKKKCEVRVTPGVLINVDTDARDITWKLAPMPNNNEPKEPIDKFRFDPGLGIEITGDDEATEFDEAAGTSGNEHKVKKKLKAKGSLAYQYNIHVQFNYKSGNGPDVWRRCGTQDPVIINRD
jgi:hypothetical protein